MPGWIQTMPFFWKKGGKDKTPIRDCSYEHVEEDDLPFLHKLVFSFDKSSKLKNFILKNAASINEKDKQGRHVFLCHQSY